MSGDWRHRTGLSPRETKLVAELAKTPGRAVLFDILLDATNAWGGTEREERKRLAAIVYFVRRQFGRDVIETVKEGKRTVGYALKRGAL